MKKAKRLLTCLLCVALILTNIMSSGIQVSAVERGTEQTYIDEGESEADIVDGEANTPSDDDAEKEKSQDEYAVDEGNEAETEENPEDESKENGEVAIPEEPKLESAEQDETGNEEIEEDIESGTESSETNDNQVASDETEENASGKKDIDVDEMLSLDVEERLALMSSDDDISSGIFNDIVWVIDKNGKLTVTGTGDYSDGSALPPWYPKWNSIISAEIRVTGMTNASSMFAYCSNLKSVDVSNFDTSQITDMSSMFAMCENLTSLDVSEFNTSQVTDMSSMFATCESLARLDVSGFDTGRVTNMRNMFSYCRSLTNLDVSEFNTSQVTYMDSMFFYCRSLTNLDVSGFDTSQVRSMQYMFNRCSGLTSLDVSGFNTSQVRSMQYMFEGCSGLTSLDVSGFNTSQVTDMRSVFHSCSSLTRLDVSGFDTSQVTDMNYMFSYCSSLTNLDVSRFNTSQVTDMEGMFYGCSGLLNLDVSGFNTDKVTDMEEMFTDCESLTSLDLSSFNANAAIEHPSGYSSGALDGCTSLITVYTPFNLKYSVSLPTAKSTDVWYQSDGSVVTKLPQNLSYSVALGKNYIPEEKVVEIDGVTIDSEEIVSNITVPKDKSVVVILDGKTGQPIKQARVWTGGEYWTGEDGEVILNQIGLTTIQIEKDGYHKRIVKKRLEKGKSVTIFLSPDTGDIQVISVSLNLIGEDEDVLENSVYLIHKDLSKVTDGSDTTYTLTIESAGQPKRYQLLQNGKVIQENTTGIFELSGKCVNSEDGTTSCYVDKLSAGYKVYVRVFDDKGQYTSQELGIKVSEASSSTLKIKEIGSNGKVELGDKLTVTFPDSIPVLGGSSLDLGFEDKLPVKITVDNSGLVKIALNMGNFDTSDSAAWYDKKQEFDGLSRRAEALWNSSATFGGIPQSFGAGMFSANGSIMGYGEGYLDDNSDSLCVTVNVIANVKAEKEYTKYGFLTLVVPIPVYITFGGGISLRATGGMDFALSGDGFVVNGGTAEIEPSIYFAPSCGVGVDKILSLGVYGRISAEYLYRFIDRYSRLSLSGSAKIKGTAFLWKKEWNLWEGKKVLYDSYRKSGRAINSLEELSIDYFNLSDAELISMDYLAKRIGDTDIPTVSVYAATQVGSSDSSRILNYAYENASPRLIQVGNKLYLFYLDGVATRSAQNQTALFYRISTDNGETWSEALRVDGGANETADYDYDIATDGNDIYVIWSDAGRVYGDELLSTDSAQAINTVGKEMDLMLAVIDGSTGAIETRTIATDDADLQPQITVGNDGNVYVAWVANDVSAEGGLLSNENGISICYALSAESYAVHSVPLADRYYPLTLDVGLLGSEICVVADLDTDGDLNTQEDREIYTMNLKTGDALSALTSNQVTDSVPVFGKVAGQNCLFWYQGGNIVYTSNGQSISQVFDADALPTMGQEFSILEGSDGKASIVWTTTSLTEDTGIDVYCSDFNGNNWSNVYRLGGLESEYTATLSGYLDDSVHHMIYLGSMYDNNELSAHICMYTPTERTDTFIAGYAEEEATPGEEYPLHLTVANTGNTTVTRLSVTSSDGSIQDTITGLSIAPGTSSELVWNGIRLPGEMSEVYSRSLTIAAEGEADVEDNTFTISVGEPDFSIEAYGDYSSGEQLANIIVTNNGILSSDAVLTVYGDEEHTEELYQSEMSDVSGGESKLSVFDLSVIDRTAPTFYFTVSDANGTERNTSDNETLLYVGKGVYLEYADGDSSIVEYITAEKTKTVYEYGDVLYTDDLTVMLHYSDGTSRETDSYSTDVDTIDMYTLGDKTLTIFYNDMTATVGVTVEPRTLDANTAVVLPYASCRYDGTAKEPLPVSVLAGGTSLIIGTDYTVSYGNNINVGEATVYITGQNHYQGIVTHSFSIVKGFAPKERKATVYAACDRASEQQMLQISDQFAGYGEITGYEISYTENEDIQGDVLSEEPVIEDGALIYRTNAGTAGDYAVITVETSFVQYENAKMIVTVMLTGKEPVVISGIEMRDSRYNGEEVSWKGKAVVMSPDGMDVTGQVALTYNYSGTQNDGAEYVDSVPPVNAGEYTLTVSVSEDDDTYIGESSYQFRILQAQTVITADNVVLTIGDPIPEDYEYSVTGLLDGDKLIKEPSFTCEVSDTGKTGAYYIVPHDADAGMNYIITYRNGLLTVADEKVVYTVTFDLAGRGTSVAAITGVEAGSLISEPRQPKAEGYIFTGWYKDKDYKKAWNFDTDTVQEDIILYACWLTTAGTDMEGVNLSIQDIRNQIYTGSALKPSVLVYSGDGTTLLKAGKDYTIKYYNNIEADTPDEVELGGISPTGEENGNSGFTKNLAYVVITGKGNYTGTLYRNFHIDSASIASSTNDTQNLAAGFTLKYTEQMETNDKKVQKPFSSLKYKKAMKIGKDYAVELTAVAAYDAEGNLMRKGSVIDEGGKDNESSTLPVIPAGYRGTFRMTVTGKGNYTGTVTKTIYLADKKYLMKNAAVTIGKNRKTVQYTGESIALTPAYYDASEKKYYTVNEDGTVNTEKTMDGQDVFIVKSGSECLIPGKDYQISYTNNLAVGTATMTVTGIGEYMGSKSVNFKIAGTPFNTKNISVDNILTSIPYTGKALTQNGVILTDQKAAQDGNVKTLVYGTDYTITYKNNLKKGTATMTFTAKSSSGYSGSFKKTFKITAAALPNVAKISAADSTKDGIVYDNDGVRLVGNIVYEKDGAKPSGRVRLINQGTGAILKEGADYTVSYTGNKAVTTESTSTLPAMNIKGKGNYSGTLKVSFKISEAELEGNGNLTVTAAAVTYNAGKADTYNYQPKVKVADGKKTLSVNQDYTITYVNCTQADVKAWLELLEQGYAFRDELDRKKPYAVITAQAGSGYKGSTIVDLNIYGTKMTGSILYVVVSDDIADTTYTGEQMRPEVTVYYGTSQAVKEAKKAKEIDESILTDQAGTYKLLKLEPWTTETGRGDYILSYGTNVAAGNNKGSITVTGIGLYGGSVTVKFKIISRAVYTEM